MTIAALVLAVDALTAAFLLGLVHCKDVRVVVYRDGLPRRVPGASLQDNPAPDLIRLRVNNPPAGKATPVYVAPSQTIGDRARARGQAAVPHFYAQKAGGW